MWIVQLALNRRYTFAVMALLIVMLGVTSISRMRTDIFPEIDIPVITMIWTCNGWGRDLGQRVVLTEGIHGDERLVVNPGDDFADGMPVQIETHESARELAGR